MADLVVTPANVRVSSDASVVVVTAAEAIERGQAVYLDTSVQKYKLALATTEDPSIVAGVALTKSLADGDQFVLQLSGRLFPGVTMAQGQLYYLSNTAGGIAPFADVTNYVTSIYRAVTTTQAIMALDPTRFTV